MGKHHARCIVCGCGFSVSHEGRSSIVAHIRSRKHVIALHSQEKQQQLGQFFRKEDGDSDVRAECLFMGFLLEHNIPLTAADYVGPLFRKMFPTSDIAKRQEAYKIHFLMGLLVFVKSCSLLLHGLLHHLRNRETLYCPRVDDGA
ncbi:hypothetical protein HPB51_018421 [Rhipicephalus microplus]|uniref:Uncharacterized protein n=1 Tax=Rhipicephalus microplus TaxID=6941 RepID=A0A9J6EIX3_RHIMP|nr:hypothetical protein HPB51_018421 [Rhipicephalus microplus]